MRTSFKELKRIARENLTGHYKIPMGAFVLAGLITFVIELPFSMFLQNEHSTELQAVIYVIVEILVSLLGVVLSAGVMEIHLNMARHREYRLSQTFGLVKARPDRYLIAGFLLMLILFVTMIPGVAGTAYAFFHPTTWWVILAITLAMFSVAAAIAMSLKLSLVYYIMLDEETLSPWQALAESMRLMTGNTWRLFWLYFSFLGYLLLGVITLGIGMLWVVPYQSQTMTQFYLAVRKEDAQYDA